MRVRLNIALLRDIVAKSNLSQNHWALKMGVSRGHWSDIINGKHPYPSPKTRQRIAEVFDLPADQLFIAESGPTTWGDVDFRAALYDRYAIDRELGQGAMGSVYLARDVARGRTVAIKVLAPEAISEIGAEGFLREISVVSRLHHPNILPLFDAGEVAGHPFYVMPWIRQGSLRDLLRRKVRLSLEEVVPLVKGVAAALQYAHSERVLHCDVKPENILLYDTHPYVMDFGISRVVHAEVSELRAQRGLDVSAGTPAYVSPEQANGDPDLDGRADVYSLGCVVYELLAGKTPFEGTTTDAVVARRFIAPPPPLKEFAPELPASVIDVITRAMAIDRTKRIASPREFAEDLARATAGGGTALEKISVGVTRAVGTIKARAGRTSANSFGGSVVQLAQDARFALHSIRRNWRFALAFIIPLALGLGAGATFYSIIDQILHRPPPHVRDPQSIVRVAIADKRIPDPFTAGNTSVAYYDYEALARHTTTLSGVAGYQTVRQSLGRGENARVIPGMLTTASYFSVLGVQPQLGRFFTAEEDAQTSNSVPCVAGDRFWRTELGASQSLNQKLEFGTLRCTIVGVTPPGFNGTGVTPIDLYIPLRAGGEASQGDGALWNTDGSHWMRILARAKPGVTFAAINQDATLAYRTVTNRQRRDPKLENTMMADKLIGSTSSSTSQRIKLARWLVGGAIALVLLVAANVVNLLVARNLARIRETAIRLALGGSRARLFRYHLFECLALSVLAGSASLLVVKWVGPVARAALYPGTTWADGPVTIRIVGLAMALSLVLGVIIAAITSMYASRIDPAALLAAGGGVRSTGTRRTHRLRMVLVGTQAALSVALLLASSGFVRSFRTAADSALGFDIHGMVFAEVPYYRFLDSTKAGEDALYDELHERVKTLPGVTNVSLGYMVPWFYNRNEELHVPGRDSLPLVPNFGSPAFDAVTPDYLATMRMNLRAGRWFTDQDKAGSDPVIVIGAALAKLYWPDEPNVIGKCIQVGTLPACREIVGIVDDIRFTGAIDAPLVASYYLPISQAGGYNMSRRLFIRTRDANATMPAIRKLVQGARPGLPAADVHAMQDQLDPYLSSWRLGAMAFTALGIVAAIIATLGLFSVMAYLVAERQREFAIRSALGARAGQILQPLLTQGLVIVGAGSAIGVFAAWRAAKWIQPLLYRTQLLELWVVFVVVALLLFAGCAAALGPARKASGADPIDALRAD